jgi:hypothetical protein
MCCIWSWAPCVLLFVVAFGALAGFIPPTGEDWSTARIVEFYAGNRDGIRAGLILSMFATALMLPFYAAVSDNIRKIEGPGSLLAPVQFGGAVILVAFFQIICLLWLLASFRADSSPDLIRGATDYGWLVWTILIPTYSLQYICMAVAGFMDFRKDVLWPRWACWANLWVAFLGAGGVLAIFFKHGPFSWEGIIGIWIPVIAFAAGTTMTMVLILSRDRRRRLAGSPPTRVASPTGRPTPATVATR